jgi:hypothetical protein
VAEIVSGTMELPHFAISQAVRPIKIGPEQSKTCEARMATINTGFGGPQGVGEASFLGLQDGAGGYVEGRSCRLDITSVFGQSGIRYFGANYKHLYINTNGLVSFTAPVSGHKPATLDRLGCPAIAVFYAPLDLGSGSASGNNNIYWDINPAKGRVTITWLNVQAHSGSDKSNTFQLELEHTGGGHFEAEFIYEKVQWAIGHTGVAEIGMTDGDAKTCFLGASGDVPAILALPKTRFNADQAKGVWSTRCLNDKPGSFVAGTMIATPDGPRAIDALCAGDWVDTLDDGPQRLLWVGGGAVVAQDQALPLCISAGVLNNDRDLWISDQHLLMLSGLDCQILFGEAEVLVAAQHLLGMPGVFRAVGVGKVRYYHMLLDQHQIVIAEGTEAETLRHPEVASERCGAAVQGLGPFGTIPAARRVLQPHEAKAWVGRRIAQHRILRPADPCELGIRVA